MRFKQVMLAVLLAAAALAPAQNRTYRIEKLRDLVDFSTNHNSTFLVYDDLGTLLLIRSGRMIDVLKHFPNYKNPAYRVYPALSPDGKRVAFASGMTSLVGKGGPQEVWVFDSEDDSLHKIEERPSVIPKYVVDLPYLMALSWSPDGSDLAVNAGREKLEVWHLGTHESKVVATNIAQDTVPSWSPDGNKITYESVTMAGDNRLFHVNVVDLATGAANTIAEGRYPSWSKIGDQIAFLDIHRESYFVTTPDGLPKKRLVKSSWLAGPLVWSPDSKYALYNDYYDGGVSAIFVDLEAGKKKVLATGQHLLVIDWR